jgi:hypothetical protein
METTDRDTARRILSAALERLEGEAHPRPDEGLSPIIFIMLSQPDSQSDTGKTPQADGTNKLEKQNGVPGDKKIDLAVGIHPGLEKFTITEIASEASAPKTCFMEPDRPCVGSGACEMRGH